MTTFIHGKQGIIDMIVTRRNTVANRLLNDDKRKERGDGHLPTSHRANLQSEINAYNLLIGYLVDSDVVLLPDKPSPSQDPVEPGEHVVTVEYRIKPTEYANIDLDVAAALRGGYDANFPPDDLDESDKPLAPPCDDTDDAALNLVHRGLRFGDVDLPEPWSMRCGNLTLDSMGGYVREPLRPV
jgi:hypothetical protein